MKSEFENDVKGEEVVATFLEKYFYKKLPLRNYHRNKDMTNQNKGIDLEFITKKGHYVVDEKAAIRYPNGLKTFAFEISYVKDGVIKEGWFFDDTKETSHYILIWPIRKDIPPEKLKIEDIYSAELMLVDRFEFQKYILKKYNLGKEDFLKKAKEIRNKGKIEGPPNIKESSAKYYYSTQLAEKPINIVFRKEELLQSKAVKAYYNVTPNGLIDLLKNEIGGQET